MTPRINPTKQHRARPLLQRGAGCSSFVGSGRVVVLALVLGTLAAACGGTSRVGSEVFMARAVPAGVRSAGAGAPSAADDPASTSGLASPSGLASTSDLDGAACAVGPVPAALGLDRFYTQACLVEGLAVVSSSSVSPAALVAAGEIVRGMLGPRPDLVAAMRRGGFRLGVIGMGERAVDLPEYRDLPEILPRIDWDSARAYGASLRRPLSAVPEENLLCSALDTYPGQSALAHELGHSVLDMAVLPIDPAFGSRLEAAFAAASALPVYRNTYALKNVDEYWAEGVQDFFDASRAAYGSGGGGDGYDGPIASRASLRAADPGLYVLIAEVFGDSGSWRPACPAG